MVDFTGGEAGRLVLIERLQKGRMHLEDTLSENIQPEEAEIRSKDATASGLLTEFGAGP